MIRLQRKASPICAMKWTAEGRNTSDLLAWCRGALIFALDDDGQTIVGRLAMRNGIIQIRQGDWVVCRTEGDYVAYTEAELGNLYDIVEEDMPDITSSLMAAQL